MPTRVSNPNHQFAVKRLWTHAYEDFAQEIEVFKRHWRTDIHIVPLLATYEIRDTVIDGPTRSYCLTFPWATGDLRSFWGTNEALVRDYKIHPMDFPTMLLNYESSLPHLRRLLPPDNFDRFFWETRGRKTV